MAIPITLTTSTETITIMLVVTVENGTIALIPQIVRFVSPVAKTIEYINLVSTYSHKYRIENASTNHSQIIVATPPHEQLQGEQFVGMTVVYDPFTKENNNSVNEWTNVKKQH